MWGLTFESGRAGYSLQDPPFGVAFSLPRGPVSAVIAVGGVVPPLGSVVRSRRGGRDQAVIVGRPAGRFAIEYEAGYGEPGDVPADLRQAVLLYAAHLFDNRSATSDRRTSVVAAGLDRILDRHRIGGTA